MRIKLFQPNISKDSVNAVRRILFSSWITQGSAVEEFEKKWETEFCEPNKAVAVSSGTAALHLAYILAGIKEGDEVLTPVFTCTATNIPLLYLKATPVFVDVKKDSLVVDVEDIRRKISSKTKAIVVVHYGGMLCDMQEIWEIAKQWNIPVIEDAAQAHGVALGNMSDFTCFSFQAIKMITTVNGGMLTIKDPEKYQLAKKLRWFGIDRAASPESRWSVDITDVGFKYEMSDVNAAMGLEALKEFNETFKHFKTIADRYREKLVNVKYIGGTSFCTILAENRDEIKRKLSDAGIESGQVHFRNDKYSIFKEFKNECKNMDELESKYFVLPSHVNVSFENDDEICSIVNG